MTEERLGLTAVLHPSALDARRGVVRLHPEVMAALGAAPWDPLLLQGRRTTAALAAYAPAATDRAVLLCDDLVLGNLNLTSGSPVTVSRAAEAPASSASVSGPAEVVAAVEPAMLRFALLGKVLTAGDVVSLLPQDLSLPPDAPADQLDAARRSIAARVGTGWTSVLLTVVGVSPSPAVVTMGTVMGWQGGTSTTGSATPMAAPGPGPGTLSVSDLPGLESEAAALTEWLDVGFHGLDLLRQLGTSPRMGVLLSGPAGSGKGDLVRAVSASVGATVLTLWGPALGALDPAAAVARLRSTLDEAGRSAPSVVLVEDVEAIAPRDAPGALLPSVLDALGDAVAAGRVAIVCSTSRPEEVSPDLRRPGLLEHELTIPLPDRPQRRRLLEVATRPMPLAADVVLDDVAARTPGFVRADVTAVCREAALRAAHRHRSDPVGQPAVAVSVTQADFDAALDVVRPTAMGGSRLDIATVSLDDVGGLATVKQVLTETVLWPLAYPDTFTRLGVSPPRGVLLYGPPGCGKTYLVRAVAGSGQANVLSVKGAELLTKWVGESERAVRELFRRARDAAPAIVFLDEIDALAPVRGQSTDGGATDRVVASLLTELDGVEELRNVVVIGATNRPDLVDPALLRPGRLGRLVFVPPPDTAARAEILRAAAKGVPLAPDVDLDALAAGAEGFSAADCAALVRESALVAMRESMAAPTVTAAHVAAARERMRASLRADQVASLAAYAEQHDSGA
ncbi:MAG: AAA family ATPase [Actinomycetota bacterium]|nr:AAA family ATPase [Actinomycetota bacterium]